jgi:putative SOS response-associated peptidase YedK
MVEIFELLREPELTPRFNIAPTSQVAVVRQVGNFRELSSMRWGLVPAWSKDPKAGPLVGTACFFAREGSAHLPRLDRTPLFAPPFPRRHRIRISP